MNDVVEGSTGIEAPVADTMSGTRAGDGAWHAPDDFDRETQAVIRATVRRVYAQSPPAVRLRKPLDRRFMRGGERRGFSQLSALLTRVLRSPG